jgi:glycosyltransferase involved in cell wall biosynthesis
MLMDYRVGLFERIAERFDVRFFFQKRSEVPHGFPSVFGCDDVIRSEGIPGEDAREIRKGVRWADVFISSFVFSSYTQTGLRYGKVIGRKSIVWEEIGDRVLQEVEPRDPRYGWTGFFRAIAPGASPELRHRFRTVKGFQFFARLVDAFFVQGDLQTEALIRLGVPRVRVFQSNEYPGHRYSQVEPSAFSLPVDPDARVFLFLGRLIPIKGVDYLIRAFHELAQERSDLALLVVGEGPERSPLEELARSLGAANIHFLGAITDVARKAFLFARASAVVVPSVTFPGSREGGPLVVLEALSAGTPVVGTDALGASTSFIRDGVNGYLIPERNAEALRHALERVIGPGTIDRESVLRSFAEIPGHDHQAEQLRRAIAFVTGHA